MLYDTVLFQASIEVSRGFRHYQRCGLPSVDRAVLRSFPCIDLVQVVDAEEVQDQAAKDEIRK